MLGVIGALIFGAVYAGAWMADEDREQAARREAKKTRNYPYYWDKNGKLRHADTGRKYSTADALREIERQKREREEKRKKEEEEKKEWERLHVKKHCCVFCYNDDPEGKIFGKSQEGIGKIEVFKTWEDAIDYIKSCYIAAGNNDYEYRTPDLYTKSRLNELEKNKYIEVHYNYEREE